MMTLLQLVQEFCRRQGLTSPLIVMGSQDEQILQIVGIANEVIEDLTGRSIEWQELRKEVVWTATTTEDQGSIQTLAPYGYKKIFPETFYNRTTHLKVLGPLTDAEWAFRKARMMTGPVPAYRMRGDHLLFNPVPGAGQVFAFEYDSKYSILDADGTTYKFYFAADSDRFTLPEELMLKGLRYMWAREKGLSFATLQQEYEDIINTRASNDGGKPRVNLAGDSDLWSPGPGVFINPWNTIP